MLANLRARRRSQRIANAAWNLARAAALNDQPDQRTITPRQVIDHVWTRHLIQITADEARPHIDAAHAHWLGTNHPAA
ncbi:hypothetical protein AB0L55_39050 [Streptomyces anthocyanicus]|uniref:hypothetical protein n=1 Tax=Streptomyces anthocyanicus TaxID=68174 RepID=UPI0034493662